MHHRGPDDTGVYFSGNIGLGHKRLSIIDLASGHQPMLNEDGKIALVFNGEIYNHASIREELIAKGHCFKTQCDTEVIIHAYEEWGVESINRFNGMFAFVLFDKRDRSLWVARDRLGIKPLYYYWDSNTFICSSEVKPILKTGFVSASLNSNVLDSFFSIGYVPGGETLFKSILKLRPGHYLKIKGNRLHIKEYWDFSNIKPSEYDFQEACKKAEELIHDSVKKRLMSDVPLGAFLSGGLDSSSIVSYMTDLVDESIKTFTVGYDEKYGFSEAHYACSVAEYLKTSHFPIRLEPDNFFSSLELMTQYSEEPIVESPAIALYHLSKLARNEAIVLLSGEGADEVFAGYLLYDFMKKINEIQKILPPFFWKAIRPFRSFIPKLKHRKYWDWLSLSLEKRYQGTSCYLTNPIKKEIYTPDFFHAKGNYLNKTFNDLFKKVENNPDPINKMLYVDTKTWLADDLLLKADKMTMAASIELRVPFLDHRVVEFAASLPSSFKCRRGNGKRILKSIMGARLPPEIVKRKKMGFPVPTEKWFGGDLAGSIRERLLDNGKIPWINIKTIEKLMDQHQRRSQDHSRIIMALLVLTTWQSVFDVTS
jgi:asparagine synthase (glutamine-hydrolysing)